jgi:hypothetical protein
MNSPAESYVGPGAGLIRSLVKAMNAIIIVAGCIMALTFFFVVILRYGFSADLFAYEEWLMAIAFWMFFMASAVATYSNTHITADILGILLRDPRKIWLRGMIVTGAELVILVFLTYLGALMADHHRSENPLYRPPRGHLHRFVPDDSVFADFADCPDQDRPRGSARHRNRRMT